MIGPVVVTTIVPGDSTRLADALEIRRRVFIVEQGVDEKIERDAHDGAATHFLATIGSVPVGVARRVDLPGGVGKAGRVAALAEFRGNGVGAALMDALEADAKAGGLTEIVLHAQASVIGFYDRRGYESVGPRFFEANIEHQKMRKQL